MLLSIPRQKLHLSSVAFFLATFIAVTSAQIIISPPTQYGGGSIPISCTDTGIAYDNAGTLTCSSDMVRDSAGRIYLTRSGGSADVFLYRSDICADTANAADIYQTSGGGLEIDTGYGVGGGGCGNTGAYLFLEATTDTLWSDNFSAGTLFSYRNATGILSGAAASTSVLHIRPSSGRTSAYTEFKLAIPAGSTQYAQTNLAIFSQPDSTTHAYDASITFSANDGTNSLPAFSLGSEGTKTGGTYTLRRWYLYDQVANKTVAFIDSNNAELFILKKNLNLDNSDGNGNIYVEGLIETPSIYGGSAVSQALNIISTSGVGTTDSIVFKVGNNGGTTAMTVNHSGAITTAAATSVTNTSANSCGTSAASLGTGSTNTAGTITVGATSGTSCTLTFSAAAPHFWTCGVADTTTANLIRAIPINTTSTKFDGVMVAADVLQYACNAF